MSIYNLLDNFGHFFIHKDRLCLLLNKLDVDYDLDKIIIKLNN